MKLMQFVLLTPSWFA